MSREVKFRCWSNNIKEYLGSSNDGFNIEELSVLAGQFKNWEFEQYTGLRDKNGKEIFEGDIMQTPDGEVKYIVEWDDPHLGFWGRATGDTPDFSMGRTEENDEVIGNIHENADLIREKGGE